MRLSGISKGELFAGNRRALIYLSMLIGIEPMNTFAVAQDLASFRRQRWR